MAFNPPELNLREAPFPVAPFPLMPRAICARPLTLLLSSAEGGHDSADDDEDGTRSKEDERDNLVSVFNGQSETIMN